MCRTSETDIILSSKEVSNGEIAQKEAGNAIEVPPSKSSISDAEDRVGTPWYLAPHSRISPGFKIFTVSRCPLCPARHSRFAGRGSLQRKGQSSQKNMVVAFDINGVLLHDDKITPESRRVRELLNGDNELGIKIPYMLLTNGSGKTEVDRTEQISCILGSPISTAQSIQSHTPIQARAE
ncbi:phosphatidyl synthase [Histoplasma capsulatum H143]|uniref:Phosphatidyl synthase n=1 Tax=Ajellomyces capsulatus (strain H143) TaxID=544712 RepID=C6HJ17_AJECH|nr:phosphatidyl synthase [Histoplasma capsulatum H143]